MSLAGLFFFECIAAEPNERGLGRGTDGNALAERLPRALDAAITLLESIRGGLDAARNERYQIERPIGAGGMAEVPRISMP